ncbi:GPP34 family phosphoprotein [Streptomyces sp. NPDC059104]|uniref:GOLPH3/VPS74 family protein n=1 Tax=Streptomyces sp. NPDC059104 TaxID=3346729 RepID=UPI003698541D
MTTPRDLLIVTMDRASGPPAGQGDLSLALAGAELVDLLAAGAVALDGDRIVPGGGAPPADRLLAEAAAALVREAPYESVADWLWRRGRDLSGAYRAALEADGLLVREQRRGMSFRAGPLVPADSLARRRAADRWASEDPVLVLLAEAVGIPGHPHADAPDVPDVPDVADDSVATVLAAVNDAVVELGAVRQRRAIEEAAFDNIWRGNGG